MPVLVQPSHEARGSPLVSDAAGEYEDEEELDDDEEEAARATGVACSALGAAEAVPARARSTAERRGSAQRMVGRWRG